jgi:hypothetical protein
MLFLVELDHVKPGTTMTPESGRMFIEQVISPTIARAEQLIAEKKIVAGGPVAGRISLRLMVEADSASDVDRIISSFPPGPSPKHGSHRSSHSVSGEIMCSRCWRILRSKGGHKRSGFLRQELYACATVKRS